jgi:hypothetical protein
MYVKGAPRLSVSSVARYFDIHLVHIVHRTPTSPQQTTDTHLEPRRQGVGEPTTS